MDNDNTNRGKHISDNLGLVHSCAARFRGKGIEYDDLYQAGCLGLIKAADGFDAELGFAFSTYAVPSILGEIKRLFRDGGALKVGRGAKEKARLLMKARQELSIELDREPTLSELSAKTGQDSSEIAILINAVTPPISLTLANNEGEERQLDLPVRDSDSDLVEKISLYDSIKGLEERDSRLICHRFFEGKTQAETARLLNMTQVQVSRREKKILLYLRRALLEGD